MPPKPSNAEILGGVRERIEEAGLAGHVCEVIPIGRDVALRFKKSAPFAVKLAVGQALRN
jgi:hypothetical protein